ncbi:MAG: BlaI/MecI/CopY family transcriptional regulator [Lachnospiraceae bacterium]|nr:BlaI/MecI/CopY family transcriptional regulator [Lachnospiraceae bacterium]
MNTQLGDAEERFLNLIWDHEPINSTKLVKVCEVTMNWKKPTCFTVLRRLTEKGLVRNENSTVTACVSREELGALRGESLIQKNFNGSLPAFLVAFTEKQKLSKEDIEKIKAIIDAAE